MTRESGLRGSATCSMMRPMPSRSLIVVAVGLAVVGEGAVASQEAWSSQLYEYTPIASLSDKAGDVQDGDDKRYPERGDIDIRGVSVARRKGGFRITITTWARKRPGEIFSFFYYRPDGNGGGLIQTRYDSDGTISTDANVNPSNKVMQLPANAASFWNNSLSIFVPNRYLDPISRFRWRASTGLIGADDITDGAPNQGTSGLNPKLARYP